MRTIRIFEHISLDGVIQAPGGPDEDKDGGFPYGGWSAPLSDPLIGQTVLATHDKKFDLLLGRRTYDIWSGYWPKVKGNPIADSFNAATKYVATHNPRTLAWGPAQSLGADVADGLRRIKAEDGPDMIVWGSSSLTPLLLANGFADEVVLFVYPVLLGTGKRFFSDASTPRELALASTKVAASGVFINTYRPVGQLRTGSFTKPPT